MPCAHIQMKGLDNKGARTGPRGSLHTTSHQPDTEHCPGTPLFIAHQLPNSAIPPNWNLQELRKLSILHDWDTIINGFRYSQIHPLAFLQMVQTTQTLLPNMAFNVYYKNKKDWFASKHHYFCKINSSSLLLFINHLGQKDMDLVFLSTCSMP